MYVVLDSRGNFHAHGLIAKVSVANLAQGYRFTKAPFLMETYGSCSVIIRQAFYTQITISEFVISPETCCQEGFISHG